MILPPLGLMYGFGMDARNWLYDRVVLPSYPLGARSVSVGNLTAGGTGKTPVVALTSRILADAGETVCILTRGYGRRNPKKRVLVSDGKSLLADAATGGDEPVELARKLIGKALVIADADRVTAAKWAREEFGITAFVLDDAFQHRRARRDLDIVCIDATDPFGGGIIPAGRARERMSGLGRADAVIITRADLVDDISELTSKITAFASAAEIFTARNEISQVLPLEEYLSIGDGTSAASEPGPVLDSLGGSRRLTAFCALGNPENFFSLLARRYSDRPEAFERSAVKGFPDHHLYTQQDIDRLEQQVHSSGIDCLLTTAKDAVKLLGLRFGLPVYVVEVEVVVGDEAEFRRLIVGGQKTGQIKTG